MRPAPSTVIFAAIVALCVLRSATALPLRQLHRARRANAGAAEHQQRGGAWVEAELADRVAIDIDESAGDAIEADAVTDAHANADVSVQLVPKMVAVTVAGTGVNVQCQLMVDANNENTVNAAFLQPLCGCALLKQALNVVDDLPALNSAQWVTQVTRTNPEWAKNAVKTVAKMVWNAGSWLTSHWGVIDPYDHPNGAAAYNADILAGIKPADVITVQLAALVIVSGVLSDPTPAGPNNVARSCLVVPQASNPTLTHALVHTCATTLHARAALPVIVYTFTRDDTTARNPDLALNAAINGALSLTIQLPAAVDVLHNVDGQAQATLHTWIRRAHATSFGDNLVAGVNAHPAMSTHVPALVINGQGATKNAVCAGRGQVGGVGAVVDLPAVTYNSALNPDHLIRIEHWSEVVGGVIPNVWFPTPLVSSLLGAPPANYPANANVNVDNIKVNVAGGASQEVFFINAVSGDMSSPNPGHQLAARQAAEAAFVAASGVANHAMTVAGVMTTLFEFGAPPGGGANRNRAQLNGPSRTLRRALQTAAHSNVAAVTHFGFGYFALTVRLVPRTLTFPGNGDMLPVKQVGWLGFADNHALNQGPLAGGAAGAGMHTEQRIMEQLRRFVLRLETPIGGGNGHAFKVAGMRSRWITEYDPDHSDDNNCQWMFKFMRVAATQGYFRTRPYDEVVRAAGAAAGAPWDLAQTRANLGALRAQDVISWTDPVDHYIYERFAAPEPAAFRTPFARRREAYRLAIAAGNAQSFPDAVSENTWGNQAHPGDGHPPPNNFFDLA